ncbi:unnamed protein product [Caenorhabditis angaria]|uniref:Uncharacterized protein n=1 Tax=Caenorhabditis angaria TaxID=860376 RepID=A0A9P1IU65_9PELO|nr:unnamed protein product [Caenorhabditis angaria]
MHIVSPPSISKMHLQMVSTSGMAAGPHALHQQMFSIKWVWFSSPAHRLCITSIVASIIELKTHSDDNNNIVMMTNEDKLLVVRSEIMTEKDGSRSIIVDSLAGVDVIAKLKSCVKSGVIDVVNVGIWLLKCENCGVDVDATIESFLTLNCWRIENLRRDVKQMEANIVVEQCIFICFVLMQGIHLNFISLLNKLYRIINRQWNIEFRLAHLEQFSPLVQWSRIAPMMKNAPIAPTAPMVNIAPNAPTAPITQISHYWCNSTNHTIQYSTAKIGLKHCAPYKIVIDKSQPGIGIKLAIFAPDSIGSRCARRIREQRLDRFL